MKELNDLKREFEFLKEPPNHPLQQAIHDLHKAFKNFFEGRANFPAVPQKGTERQLSLSGSEADQDRR
jgi:putative transposase